MLDNNDGITVIDVTDPESPAYCFVSVNGLECEDESNIPLMTPISATQYIRGYYPEVEKDDSETPDNPDHGEVEQSVLNTLRPYESVRMITIDMLTEAWPGEYSNKPNSTELSIEPKDTIHMPPSLVDMTFVPALHYALKTGETDSLDQFMWLPGNLSKVKETLRAHNPLSANDLKLLSKVIGVEVTQTKSIDLSHFSLTGDQLVELISPQEGVEILNISHMQQITIDILRQLIPLLPNLRRLVLLHTLPDADILTLLSESPELFYSIDSVIHFAFLRCLGKAVFPAAFSHIVNKGSGEIAVASVPYFTPDQVAQALTDYLSLLKSQDNYTLLMSMSNELPLLASYASAVREPGRSWSERIVPFIPSRTLDKLNERESWFFAWSAPSPFRSSSQHRYAFAKLNKEVSEECQRRIDELRESFNLPNHLDTPQNLEGQAAGEPDANSEAAMTSLPDELRDKINAIISEYADREFHIFDVNSFFQELVKEGRPAPSPEVLTKLLDLFTFLEKKDSPLLLMTPADLKSFLDGTQRAMERRKIIESMTL